MLQKEKITLEEFQEQLATIDKSLRSLPATAQVSSLQPYLCLVTADQLQAVNNFELYTTKPEEACHQHEGLLQLQANAAYQSRFTNNLVATCCP